VRYFTPREEVPFAGHPTLGTARVIRSELLGDPPPEVRLNLKIGQVPVTADGSEGGEVLWMRQRRPEFGQVVEPATVAALLGLSEEEIDERYPAQEVSTGLPFLIVPLTGLAAVKRSRLEPRVYEMLIRERGIKAVFLFSAETYDAGNQLNARMFADHYGVPEDPATGSANGCLAAYLGEHRYFGHESVEARVEQGYEIGRPSLLRLRARRADEEIRIEVGGRAFIVAQGELT
jgi:trans-2,3-dihydro-3-hydroxyanthranilate isomerase